MTGVAIIESDCNGKDGTIKRAVWLRLNIHDLCRITDPWYPCCVGKSGADDQTSYIYTFRIPRPPALTGRPHPVVKHTPLSSMGVSGKNKLDRAGNERQVFRVVREKNVIAWSGTVLLQPSCLWLVSRCCNRSTYSADAFLTRVVVGTAGSGTKGSIVRNVSGGQASQNHFLAVHGNGLPFIIQHCHAGCSEDGEILPVHHPFMVAEGKKGWGDGRTGYQKRQDVILHFQRRAIIFWVTAVKEVAGDADEGRTVRVQARYDRRGIRIMEVGKQRQIWRSGDMVDCLFRRGSPPAVELTVKPGT